LSGAKIRPSDAGCGTGIASTSTGARFGSFFDPTSPEHIEQQVRAATTLTELFAVVETNPEPEDDYDLLRALDDNRKGERPVGDNFAD